MNSLILTEIKDDIGIIKLNNPEKRNALSPGLIKDFLSALKQLESNDEVFGIIITGEGKAFSAGADLSYLKKLQSNSLIENEKDSSLVAELFVALYECNKLTVAAVNGAALAGGCGLALACDYIIAKKEEAKFGFTEVKIGFVPAIISFLVLKRIPEAKARQLLISGKILSAEEAEHTGLIDFVEDDVFDFSIKLIKSLSSNSSASISETKKLIRAVSGMHYKNAVEYAKTVNALSRTSQDFQNGLNNFLTKH
ncbi:MAG: enoyl-CoA hydratase/isomerase family protein [Ignavibacteriaceae bacterium]|nr:enoyl-CoA hydratase/isomerase family protein [Ignavibacteriaceae bacterium]